jgi:hypothetical protein
MAGRGPAPKPADKRLGNHAVEAATELTGGRVAAPRLTGRAKLVPAARRWWDTWAKSPQAAQFIATDWLTLEVIVRLVDDFHRAEDAKARKEIAGELRLQAAKLGATPEDRLRLRWRMSENAGAEERSEKKAAKTKRRRTDPRLKLVEGGS